MVQGSRLRRVVHPQRSRAARLVEHGLVARSCESLGEGRTSMRDPFRDGHGNVNDVHVWSLLYDNVRS